MTAGIVDWQARIGILVVVDRCKRSCINIARPGCASGSPSLSSTPSTATVANQGVDRYASQVKLLRD